MKKLKKLSQEDLDNISEFVSSSAHNFILQRVSRKEISEIDIKVEMSYDEELDVDVSIELIFDELCVQDPEIVHEAVDFAHEELDMFLDENYRV